MTDHDALVRAVCEFPGDDTVRLVYADWLDQHGYADRAEFVRVQCELARHPRRLVVSEVAPLDPAGPDYWTLGGGALVDGGGVLMLSAKPGMRVDILKPSMPRGRKAKQLLGLRVVKLTGEDNATVVLARDDQTGPDPTPPLRSRERELFAAHQFPWFALPTNWQTATDEREADGRPLAVVSRGFVGKLVCPAAAFTETLARAVFGAQPVTEIVISDAVFTQRPGWGWCGYESRLPQPCVDPRKMLGHRTEADARRALSDELVAWARGLVGLPPVARAAGAHNGGR